MEMTDSGEQAVKSIIHIYSATATYTFSSSTVTSENVLAQLNVCIYIQAKAAILYTFTRK